MGYYHSEYSKGFKYYAPRFKEDDYIYGTYLTSRFSWLRLILHECDNSTEAINERIRNSKKHIHCVSTEEQRKYFEDVIHAIDFRT